MGFALGEIKFIINKETNTKFEGPALDKWMVEYATHNRDQFILGFSGDVVVQTPDVLIAQDKAPSGPPVLTREELEAMTKADLKALAREHGLEFDDSVLSEDMIDLILKGQD